MKKILLALVLLFSISESFAQIDFRSGGINGYGGGNFSRGGFSSGRGGGGASGGQLFLVSLGVHYDAVIEKPGAFAEIGLGKYSIFASYVPNTIEIPTVDGKLESIDQNVRTIQLRSRAPFITDYTYIFAGAGMQTVTAKVNGQDISADQGIGELGPGVRFRFGKIGIMAEAGFQVYGGAFSIDVNGVGSTTNTDGSFGFDFKSARFGVIFIL
ncbi:MAG: hypothetical protein N4A45_05975 [Flavobacteriales bacterium]|jgi:hypothetical protein|nr:hypothetical protein [Flavobacteriales bacterium]